MRGRESRAHRHLNGRTAGAFCSFEQKSENLLRWTEILPFLHFFWLCNVEMTIIFANLIIFIDYMVILPLVFARSTSVAGCMLQATGEGREEQQL